MSNELENIDDEKKKQKKKKNRKWRNAIQIKEYNKK